MSKGLGAFGAETPPVWSLPLGTTTGLPNVNVGSVVRLTTTSPLAGACRRINVNNSLSIRQPHG